eukprot:jgi/Tetstr1/425252/TSEL_015706.t1
MSLRNTATDKVSKKWSLHNPEKQLRQFDRKDDDSMNAIVERSSRAESLDELLWDAVKELGLGDVPHDIVNKLLMGDITKPKEYLEGVAASIKSISCFESEWKTGPSWMPSSKDALPSIFPGVQCSGPTFLIEVEAGQIVFPMGSTDVEYFPPTVKLVKVPARCEVVFQGPNIVMDSTCVPGLNSKKKWKRKYGGDRIKFKDFKWKTNKAD